MKAFFQLFLPFYCLSFLCFVNVMAQSQNQTFNNHRIDSLVSEIRKVNEKLENQEKMMDLMIEKKIWEELSSILNIWGYIIAGLLAVLGFFGFKGVDSMVRARVDEIINKKVKSKTGSKMPKPENDRGAINREQTHSILELQLKEIQDKLALDKNYAQALDKAKVNFEKSAEIGEKTLAAKYLDLIASCNFYLKKDADNDILFKKYENEYDFSYLSYANMAIVYYDKYELNGGNAMRDFALKYAEKSLQKLPNYGTAQAIKLLVYAIDYKNLNDLNLKEQSKIHAKNVFSEILFGNSLVSSYETYSYLYKIISNPHSPFNQYIHILTELFPMEWAELKRRDQEYVNSFMGGISNQAPSL